ncbi:MAG TPA: T9SS type A sorting domain-containing protein [Chitinophagaceae bacterium]|nr:T9SS type A sorting domain-containing protein [Chitinophagaceae bacterium]
MKRQLWLLILACAANSAVRTQTISPQALAASGTSGAAGGAQLEWTFGEFPAGTLQNGMFLTQGFLQPGLTWKAPPPPPALPVNGTGYGLNSAGTTFFKNNLLLEWDLGEVAVAPLTANNRMLTQGLLQPGTAPVLAALPVSGLELTARRVHPGRVELEWKTLSESNNAGFRVERRLEGEPDFTPLHYVRSQAYSGNSRMELTYPYADTNRFAGKSWYRIRQEDASGEYAYSPIRLVTGLVEETATLDVWPVPASTFYVALEGGARDEALLYDMNGRLLRRLPLVNGTPAAVSGLPAGTYVLRLQSRPDYRAKAIVQ